MSNKSGASKKLNENTKQTTLVTDKDKDEKGMTFGNNEKVKINVTEEKLDDTDSDANKQKEKDKGEVK